MIGRTLNPWNALPVLALCGALSIGGRLAAQANPTSGDTEQQIQEIAREVAEQLEAVDKMLLESSRNRAARKTSSQKLEQSMDVNRTATEGVDRLIEKLHELKAKCGN
ncbi:MAG: hypothetical protein NXI31_17250 [bacterium]|nr:hypothetical protein [bacterium]